MDDPQDPLGAFHEAYQVLTWRSPAGMVDMVRATLRRSGLLADAPAPPDVIEGMVYRCRVAEVLTICLTADTLQELCAALRRERAHVTEAYAEDREVERFRLEDRAVAAGPPRPFAAHPPPAPGPPPPEPGRQAPWPPPPGVAGPSHAPPAFRRAHLTPGPGAEEAPSSVVPPPGGKAAAGDPLPPPAKAAGRATGPSPCARHLLGGPRDLLYDVWMAAGKPPGPPGIPPVSKGSVGREVKRGGAPPVRACPYTDVRRPRAVPLGPPGQRRRGIDRHRREAGDSRSAAGHCPPEAGPQARDSEAPRPTRALCRPRLTT